MTVGGVSDQDVAATLQTGSSPKIAAVVHLYYHDLWSEIRSFLASLHHLDHDLYVTLCNEHPPADIAAVKREIGSTYDKAVIVECPNRGLDVGPFFTVMGHIAKSGKKYDFIVKIHSKKSLTVSGEEKGRRWRYELLDGLLGSKIRVDRILSIFDEKPEIGMIGPRGMLIERSSHDRAADANLNQEKMEHLGFRLGIADRTLKFFRGTMFWCRFQPVFECLAKSDVTIGDFEAGHAEDRSYAHAMERLFPCIIRSSGGKLYEFGEIEPEIAGLKKEIAKKETALQEAAARLERTEARLRERFDEIAALTRILQANEAALRRLIWSDPWPFLPAALRIRRRMAAVRRSGLFDAGWYARTYADVAASGMDPLRHFVQYGAREGRAPNAVLVGTGRRRKDRKALENS